MIIAEVDSDTAARAAGETVGQLLFMVLVVLGMYKCWEISRRPTTNRKCVLALMTFLVGWLVAAVNTVWLQGRFHLQVLHPFIRLIVFGLLITSLVLAILGLIEYARQRGRFTQGRAQAIWALVLGGFFLLFAVVGFVRGFPGPGAMRSQPGTNEPLVFSDLNFRFTTPGKPWVQVNAAGLNRAAKLAFLRARPDVWFAIIPEQVADPDFSTATLADLAAARVNSVGDSVRVLERTPVRLGRMDGLRVYTQARLNGYDLFYLQWFYATNGWSYQLMTWGQAKNKDAVIEAANQLMPRFEMIDPERRPPLKGENVITDFAPTNYAFRVRCGDSNWLQWHDLDTDCVYASFGVLNRTGTALVVSAIDLMGTEPREDAIYRGLANVSNLFDQTDPLANAKPIEEKGLKGIEVRTIRTANDGKDYSYRVKVLQGGGYAYLVAAWIENRNPNKEQLLGEAISRVEFLGGTPARLTPALMSAREKRAHRILLNSIGLTYYKQEQYEPSVRFFQQAVEFDGLQKGTSYLANLVHAWTVLGKFREALDALEQHSAFVATQPELQAQQASLQRRMGLTEVALTNYARLFANGYQDEDAFDDYLSLLAANGQADQALKEVESWLKQRDTPAAHLAQARLLKQLKHFDAAIAALETQRKKNPFQLGIAYSLGDAYLQTGRATEARALGQELLDKQGSSLTAWYLKGRAEYALKWYRESKVSFEAAAKESPSDQDVRDYLQLVSSALGEGSTAGIKDPISPVPVPEELLTIPPPPPPGFGREEGAYFLRNLRAVSFKKGKELKRTDYFSFKVLTSEGVSAFSSYQIRFSPMNEELFVNELLVKDASGMLVSTGRVADYYVLDEKDSAASTRKILNIPVAGLEPGGVVELTVTRRELGKIEEFTFLPHYLARNYPVVESALYLIGDTQSVTYASLPNLPPQRLGDGLCWRLTNPPVVRWEPFLPGVTDYLPMVWLGDANARWPDLVTNYLAAIRDHLTLPENQRELAAKLTASCTNSAQKIAAVAAYVQTNYTYKAIEFGRRARVPQMPADFVRNRYGDCKDHALLAQQMLNAVGIPASLALVSWDSAIRPDVPSLDQFDHMIVYIPESTGDVFLDCTAKGTRLEESWTSGLAGHEALILNENGSRFVRIANYPTNASLIRIARAIQFTNQTEALVSETLKLDGVHAGYLRDYLAAQSVAGRHAYVAGQFVGGAGELLDLTILGLDEPQRDLELKFTYRLRSQFHLSQDQFVGSLPLGCERTYLIEEPVAKRTLPFQMTVPLTIESTVNVALPSGYKARTRSEPKHKIATSFVTCESVSEMRDNNWRFDFHLYRPAGEFRAEEYANHRRALQDAIHELEPSLVCERTTP